MNHGDVSQPSIDEPYKTAGNPTDHQPTETRQANRNAAAESVPIDRRGPNDQNSEEDAMPTSVARGIRGAPPGEERKGYTQEGLDSEELDAAQMGAPGEGKVESAVKRKPGASGGEPGLETDLDRKKAEQAPLRQSVQQSEAEDVNVGGVLGQRGGPANPVDKDGYPNSGS